MDPLKLTAEMRESLAEWALAQQGKYADKVDGALFLNAMMSAMFMMATDASVTFGCPRERFLKNAAEHYDVQADNHKMNLSRN